MTKEELDRIEVELKVDKLRIEVNELGHPLRRMVLLQPAILVVATVVATVSGLLATINGIHESQHRRDAPERQIAQGTEGWPIEQVLDKSNAQIDEKFRQFSSTLASSLPKQGVAAQAASLRPSQSKNGLVKQAPLYPSNSSSPQMPNSQDELRPEFQVSQHTKLDLEPSLIGISLNKGEIGRVNSLTSKGCCGNFPSSGHPIYESTDIYLADINPLTGTLCAGSWNRNTGDGIADYTVCTAAPTSGIAYVTAISQGIESQSIPAFIQH